MPPRPTEQTEAEQWRAKADEALRKFSKAMDFFLFTTAQLVKLSTVHTPDDYNHCACCKVPWPCESMQAIKAIGEAWVQTQNDVK